MSCCRTAGSAPTEACQGAQTRRTNNPAVVRPMRKTRAATQSQRAIGHIAALQFIATMFVMHAMVGRSTLQFKMPRLDAYAVCTMLHDQRTTS